MARGKMSLRRRALIEACDGDREQVRLHEADLKRRGAAKRAARVRERRRKTLYRDLGWE